MMNEPELPGEPGANQNPEPTAGKLEFRGKKLIFSFDHGAAARRLYSESIDENCVIVTYLGTLPAEVVVGIVTKEERNKFRLEMGKWATANKIVFMPDNRGFKECMAIAETIWGDLAKVDFEPDIESGGKPDPNSLG